MLELYSSKWIFSIKIGGLKIACIFARSSLDSYFLFVNILVSYHDVEISDDALQFLQSTSCLDWPKLILSKSHQLPKRYLILMHLFRHNSHKHTAQ